MEAPIRFCILHQAVALFIGLAAILLIFIGVLREVIVVHKVIPRVIRRVNINHLHFSKIRFPNHFQHIKVIALDVKVLRMVEVYAFFPTRAQRLVGWRVGQVRMGFLVRPRKLITFFSVINHISRQFITQLLKVNAKHRLSVLILALRHTLWKQTRYLVYVRVCYIEALYF